MNAPRTAVLELTTAMHNWRRDPSPDNTRKVILASELVCGHTLALTEAAERAADAPTVNIVHNCTCGSVLVRVLKEQTHNVPILTCGNPNCGSVFAFVRLNGGPSA